MYVNPVYLLLLARAAPELPDLFLAGHIRPVVFTGNFFQLLTSKLKTRNLQ